MILILALWAQHDSTIVHCIDVTSDHEPHNPVIYIQLPSTAIDKLNPFATM